MAPVRAPMLTKPSPWYTNSPVYQTNSTFIVSRIVNQHLVEICFTSSSRVAYKPLPSIKNIFTYASFFSCFIFIIHLFHGLAGAYVNPGSFSFFVHSLVYPITHSHLDGFQPNLVQHSPHVCSTCHTVFSLKNTLECVCERLLHCRLIFAIAWTPNKSFT